MEKVNTMSGNVEKKWNQLVVTPLYIGSELKVYWHPPPLIRPMENAKNPKFEFYFDYGKNVFQWTLNKPPWHLNKNDPHLQTEWPFFST